MQIIFHSKQNIIPEHISVLLPYTKEPNGNSARAPERMTLASNANNKPLTGMQLASNKDGISIDLGSESRALIPQGLTPEYITTAATFWGECGHFPLK